MTLSAASVATAATQDLTLWPGGQAEPAGSTGSAGAPGAPAPWQAGQPHGAGGVAPLGGVASRPRSGPPSFDGLPACIDEAAAAALRTGDGPPDPRGFGPLLARLERARAELPPSLQRAAADPLLSALRQLGADGFAGLLAEDPDGEGAARLLLDLSQALLQQVEGYQPRASAAFREVVTDLYEGFLSAESRQGVKPPDHGVTAPLVRWGSGEDGPYTWPAEAAATFGVQAALVSLPAANASAGLLAWPALAHETAGHDILSADAGLTDELGSAVRARVLAERMHPAVAGYWADRIEEAAADVLGVLNMGPAAAVGLIGYFRALNGAWGGTPALRSDGPAEDPHPADLARAYLAAETVRLLSFQGAAAWADRLVAEADRDLGRIRLGGVAVTAGVAKASAAVVAQAIVRTRLDALEGHALGEIQDWRDRDEALVSELRRALADGPTGRARPGAAGQAEGASAAHAVAAAVYEGVGGGTSPSRVLGRMIGLLAEMNGSQPAAERLSLQAAPPPIRRSA